MMRYGHKQVTRSLSSGMTAVKSGNKGQAIICFTDSIAGGANMKKVLPGLFVLKVLFIVWYKWNNSAPPRSAKVLANIVPITMRLHRMKTLITKDSDGRELRSATLSVGTQQGTLNCYVYKPSPTANRATVLLNGCTKVGSNDDKVQLITGFIAYMRNEKYQQAIAYLLKEATDGSDVIEIRQMEVINVLQDNLQHPSIGRIHVLVWDKGTADYIKSLPLKNSDKLVLRVIGKDVGLQEQLVYASDCLPGKIVAITNQDNNLGEGWDDAEDHGVLRDNDIMYALKRHPPPEASCAWLQHSGNCNGNADRVGRRDTFVLRAKKWNTDVLNELKSGTLDKPEMEKFVIWFFTNKLRYRIMNPCERLFVHHHHCVPI